MTIQERMAAVFAAAQIPGFYQLWRRTDACPEIPDTYCVYNVTASGDALNADDREAVRWIRLQAILYGKGELTEAVDALRTALEAGGFLIRGIRDGGAVISGAYLYARVMDLAFYEYM